MSATLIPWRVHKARAGGGALGSIHDVGIVGDEDGLSVVIAETWVECVGPGNTKIICDAGANAEFIVRACNSYGDLLGALKELVEGGEFFMSAIELNHTGMDGEEWEKRARAAIARAEDAS